MLQKVPGFCVLYAVYIICSLFQMTLAGLHIFPTLLIVSITTVVLFILFQYMHTEIPEGVKEVWGARILDTALRTNGHIVSIFV